MNQNKQKKGQQEQKTMSRKLSMQTSVNQSGGYDYNFEEVWGMIRRLKPRIHLVEEGAEINITYLENLINEV